VEGFFVHHGAKAILLGRFIGIVRAVAPFLAGASGLRLRAFMPWSVIGTAACDDVHPSRLRFPPVVQRSGGRPDPRSPGPRRAGGGGLGIPRAAALTRKMA
jgi:hypothetical protein